MAITVDTPGENGGTSVSSYTISITVASGASALFCTLHTKDGTQSNTIPTVAWDVAGVNEALSLVGTEHYDGTSTHSVSVHGLLAPTAKTALVTVTLGGTCSWGYGCAFSVQGGSASALSEATGIDTGSGSDYEPDVDVTSVTDGAIIIAAHSHRVDNAAQTAGYTSLFENDSVGGDNCASQYNIKATAGALNLAWTGSFSTESRWVSSGIAYAPAAVAGGTPTGTHTVLGVGI